MKTWLTLEKRERLRAQLGPVLRVAVGATIGVAFGLGAVPQECAEVARSILFAL